MNIPSVIKYPFQKIGFFQDRSPAVISQPNRKVMMRNFGDPEPVLDGQSLFQYGYCPEWQEWYELPYDIEATARLFRATSHHTSALIVKRNILNSTFIPHPLLNRQQFDALALNILTFANAYAHVSRKFTAV